MSEIELVIKIPEEAYEQIIEAGELDYLEVITAIENGTPLPKGHWINADEEITALLYNDQYEEYKEEKMTIAEYLDGYTNEGCPVSIIEADKEKEEWER